MLRDTPLQYLTGAGTRAYPVVTMTWAVIVISVVVMMLITALVVVGTLKRRPPAAPDAQGRRQVSREGGLAYVAWRIWGRKRNAAQDDDYASVTPYNSGGATLTTEKRDSQGGSTTYANGLERYGERYGDNVGSGSHNVNTSSNSRQPYLSYSSRALWCPTV